MLNLKQRSWLIVFFTIMTLTLSFTLVRQYSNLFGEVIQISQKQHRELALINIAAYLGKNSIWVYFTIQSNVVLAITFLIIFLKWTKLTQYCFHFALVYISVTFLIFWTALAPSLPWNYPYFTIENLLLHFISPLLAFVFYWQVRRKINLRVRYTLSIVLIYPLSYFIMSLILYYTIFETKVSIYPFLDLKAPFGWKLPFVALIAVDSVIIIVIILLIIMISLLYLYFGKRQQRSGGEIGRRSGLKIHRGNL